MITASISVLVWSTFPLTWWKHFNRETAYRGVDSYKELKREMDVTQDDE